ncbi:hypothetical protein ABVN80_04140 [Acinetobacter baumannii]
MISSMAHGENVAIARFSLLCFIWYWFIFITTATTKTDIIKCISLAVHRTMFRVTHIIMKYAPNGVF